MRLISFLALLKCAAALPYDEAEVGYNLNTNQNARNPLEYSGDWDNHTYQASPDNWRFPFYSFMIDKFVNGDATNDDANGTAWEHDPLGTQLRNGGDIQGVVDSLDYLHGMGIRGIYIVGSVMINFPWAGDAYSPLDLTLLDRHFGSIETWRSAIEAIHAKGMYIILDNTMATMSDLIGFDGYLNSSAPWSFEEHDSIWKTSRQYADFKFDNSWEKECNESYPRFWDQGGHQILDGNITAMVGCRNSEFDQYGDVGAFGTYPEWQKQLSKFGSVQDRLREWKPSVRAKIEHFSCMLIGALDIDGFRIDKGMQVTVDAQGNFSSAMRTCARKYGKDNFFIPGEIVNGNSNAAIYIGRGKQPDMKFDNLTVAFNATNETATPYIRDAGQSALDAAAFHYSIYRGFQRFLGLDGDLLASDDIAVNFVQAWQSIVLTNDMVNANTGKYDPRHMYGVGNHDVLRWPGLVDGTLKQLLGAFVTTLEMPGMPLLTWGEEQAFYILDSTAGNYLYGRQSMASSIAWQRHGCYKVGDSNLHEAPFNSTLHGCSDDSVSLDHRDTTHPLYTIYKMMFQMRARYPVLQDGFSLEQLSNTTYNITLPGSLGVPTETGLWSVHRSGWNATQDFTGIGQGNQSVWLLYSNENSSKTFEAACDSKAALLSPFSIGTTVKNLFYPFDEWVLENSTLPQYVGGDFSYRACVSSMNMTAYGYKAFVPVDTWMKPSPHMTKVSPSHDERLLSQVGPTEQETVPIKIEFSHEMDCDSVADGLTIQSTVEDGSTATLDSNSVECLTLTSVVDPPFYGGMPSLWSFSANVVNVSNGVHVLSLKNVSAQNSEGYTNSVDRFMFRIGQEDNPMVFIDSANYSSTVLFKEKLVNRDTDKSERLYINHKAAGADKFRYSTNWGSSWSSWMDYTGGNTTIQPQSWSGLDHQKWSGDHVKLQYWSKASGSSSHLQEGDLYGSDNPPRRFPHFFVHGPFNLYGYDAGITNEMSQDSNGTWQWDFMTEWPGKFQVNVWGMNPDGFPDVGRAFGDVDNDTVLDRIPPISLEQAVVNITEAVGARLYGPISPYLAYRILINDADLRYYLKPVGSRWKQLALFILLALIPALTAVLAVQSYRGAFYKVKFNQVGLREAKSIVPVAIRQIIWPTSWHGEKIHDSDTELSPTTTMVQRESTIIDSAGSAGGFGISLPRRSVLIGTMEYDIEDWGIKIKIGGLGVMAQLMGKSLTHQDLVWVVPCVGGVDYPIDTPGEPMHIQILGKVYEIRVQYHMLNNITYVLLDAPVFRKQTKAEPYPPRMDDLESAIYYSAWNQCIAETMRRFPVDLYHINDYHGTLAPLYLLPDTMVPCCLSLHNAEFQGLWPIRTVEEREEICGVFNLPQAIMQRYVQFGEVFNLLHAGASILRLHQNGFGAVGVSKKYGKRSYARYPIFWGLKRIGALPNPDPSDVEEWDKKLNDPNETTVDQTFEAGRADLKRQAQEWAGLEQRADADLFVFVGRWSMQKGIDLIADVFPAVLERYPHVQLLCVGPVIDLYGKFAALKLERMMEKYPGRVYSKPEFTALPSFIFSGAEFALIPSRDEPFGLVAVEFGRKGALGVGARVGGLGQVPGWWFTVESMSTKHLIHQFKTAINEALKSKQDIRATMRARSAKTRFPVQQWKEDLEILQSTSIKLHKRNAAKDGQKRSNHWSLKTAESRSGTATPSFGWAPRSSTASPMFGMSGWTTPRMMSTPRTSAPNTRESSPTRDSENVVQSLGRRTGPGHVRNNSSIQSVRATLRSSRPSSRTHSRDTSLEVDREPRAAIANRTSLDIVEASNRGRLRPLSTIIDSRESILLQPPGTPTLRPESDEYTLTAQQAEANKRQSYYQTWGDENRDLASTLRLGQNDSQIFDFALTTPSGSPAIGAYDALALPQPGFVREHRRDSPERSGTMTPSSPTGEDGLLQQGAYMRPDDLQLSLEKVIESKQDKRPQDLTPFFTDPTGLYFRTFDERLGKLNGKTSEGPLCIEEYLIKSEKQWFDRRHEVAMHKKETSSVPGTRTASPAGSIFNERLGAGNDTDLDQFMLPADYETPTGVKRLLNTKLGDWPVYAFLLAFGQILSANSYQITLLTGQVGQPASKLYTVACIYLASSIIWWVIFRRFKAVHVISAPWIFFGLAFFLLAISPYPKTASGRGWVQNVATGCYAIASASGSFFFAQNFGSQGAAPVKTWGFRACTIQGTQQVYIVALWYWGSTINTRSNRGITTSILDWRMTAVAIPVAIFLWAIAVLLYLGLPEFYRQTPGAVPSFYKSALRRKIVLWFFVAVAIQTYFLSAPYGRNWTYLWSSQHAPAWSIMLLIILFFVLIWAGLLFYFSRESVTHSWILPIFAVGLGAPRWCQMLWATSNIGAYLPWAGGPVASALLGRSLWLWLGVLDSLQGVGFGIILLQTLTRFHITFALIAAQVIGSFFTILARATAPNKLGPGDIFPDFSVGWSEGLSKPWFWVGLVAQGVVCVGFFAFFRKDQLSKP